MIIDSLTHVTPDGNWFGTSHDASLGRLLAEMDKAGVDRSVVSALAGHIENDFVLRTCRAHRGRLIPGLSHNPAAYSSPAESKVAVRAIIAGEDFPVLKLHPRLNGYDPLDPRCLAVLEAVAEAVHPPIVYLDTLFRSSKFRLMRPPAETVHDLLLRFPTVRFVLLHGGGSQLLAFSEIAAACGNATLDLSMALLHYERSSLAADIRFVLSRYDRIIVAGSDFPEYTPAAYLERIRSEAAMLGLSEEKIANVLGRNLGGLLPA